MKRILILLCLPVFLWSNNLSAQCFVSTTDVSCYGACDGFINVITTSGTAPYEYRVNGGTWSPMVGGSVTLFSLCPLVYNIDIRDVFFVIQNCTGTINQPSPLVSTMTATPPSAPGLCDGYLNATVTGGTTPYSLNWGVCNPPNALCAGDSCCVLITDGNGCSSGLVCATVPGCVYGCTDTTACNYDSTALCDDGSCVLPDGCTDTTACNYDPTALCDDGSCVLPDGCTDTSACNYDPLAICDDGSCVLPDGCTDPLACNYDSTALCDDGSCVYSVTWSQTFAICDGDSVVVGPNVYDTTGVYTDTLNASNGCDSIVQTYIVVNQNTSSYDTLSVTVSIVWNGIPLTISGDYSITLINSVGCDSIVNLNLTISPSGILNIKNTEKTLLRVTDILGRETKETKNELLFYIYDDGTVEKRIVIE